MKLCSSVLFTLLFVTICESVYAQSFHGLIINSEQKTTISGALVYLVELDAATVSNSEGVFTIDHYPKKVVHIQISAEGYSTINEDLDLSKIDEKVFSLEPSHVDLQEVVVSVPNGKLARENIISIERLKLQDLKPSANLTLVNQISNIAGVDQTTTGAGIGKPIIRGLSGNRIVTYAQGIRIENQQWGDEHGLGIGDVGIESVEVIKGPASLLYGSDAIGGVLYFVDERYAPHNQFEGFLKSRFTSSTMGFLNSAGVKFHKEKLKVNLFGTYSSHADYQVPDFERVQNTRFDEQNFKASLGYNYNNWISNIRYSYLKNTFGLTDTALYTESVQRKPEIPFQLIQNHNISFENTFFTGSSRLSLILGQTLNSRQEFEDNPDLAALNMNLNSSTYNLKWYSPKIKDDWSFIVGSQGMYQTNVNSGEETLIPDANTSDLSLFSVIHYDKDRLKLQGGIRADTRKILTEGNSTPESKPLSKNYSSINYSIGSVFLLNQVSLRVNVASGYRAPNTSELLSDGVHEGTNRYEKGNVDLKSEYATQFDFTIDYQDDHIQFTVNPFFNYINNYIFLSPTDSLIDGNPLFYYEQTQARFAGGEIGIHYHPHRIHWLHLESSFSSVFAEDINDNPLPLIPANRINSTIKAEFSRHSKVMIRDVFVQHIYKFSQNRVALDETASPSYSVVNLGLNLEIKTASKPVLLSLGVNNLLNKEYIDHLSRFKTYGIPNLGVNYYIALRFDFNSRISKEE